MNSRRLSHDEDSWPQPGRGTERLRRQIARTRAVTGHPLQCSECDRVSIGRANGWTMHLGADGQPQALCPDCRKLESGGAHTGPAKAETSAPTGRPGIDMGCVVGDVLIWDGA